MKRKFLALVLTICTVFSLTSFQVSAATLSETSGVVQTVRALGIITGGTDGKMNLDSNVTRAEFAKMMVAASKYRDSVGENTSTSLFKDVKSGYWATEYIRIAVENGWFYGYTDGTFRPGNSITLEEASAATLRMLGYDSTTLVGAYPSAQLSKASALGLRDGISTKVGEKVTRSDCAYLFYNTMTAQPAAGGVYATTLGYSLTAGGQLDYTSVIKQRMSDPFVLESGTSITGTLPFSASNVTVYLNGKASTLSAATTYDVYYYNSDIRTVWIYNNRVSGTYTAAAPSTTAPTSVTVAGNTYTIGSSGAAYKLSTLGGYSMGDSVTLLLGMDGTVIDVVSTASVTSKYYGVVTQNGTGSYTNAGGAIVSSKYVKVACTDGVVRQFNTTYEVKVGSVVSYSSDTGKVSSLSEKTISGKVNAAGTKFGSIEFADDVQILDVSSNGDYGVVYPSKLAGNTISSNAVKYYILDSNNQISYLILNDATGDIHTYGLLTEVNEVSTDMVISGSYQYMINGAAGVYASPNAVFGVSTGGATFKYKDGSIDSIKNINSVHLSSVSGLTATNSSTSYAVSDTVQVYVYSSGKYTASNLTSIANNPGYSLTGYYDNSTLGGKIRVIVALAK